VQKGSTLPPASPGYPAGIFFFEEEEEAKEAAC
jgi:hypothetical protein